MHTLFDPQVPVLVPVIGNQSSFPVRRVYCVGKNYAAHIREMGSDPERDEPCFFLKPADAVVLDGQVPYPLGTSDLHYEGELVLAIGKEGRDIPVSKAGEFILGYAAGLDMTRRDLQTAAGAQGMPWDTGKAFDYSAPLGPICLQEACGELEAGPIRLWVNDELRQNADLADLIWTCREIVAQLSMLYTLKPGDLIYTGTPAGVGAVVRGDRIRVGIGDLPGLEVEIV
ncbi:MAG TPA: fumarylacetoacetate hydrolase family protein [Pseudomonadaceae bacterium]|nr:fumarylacetoacetate hydrolase family protein [Pseudomonadaceae bacterium]